MGNRTEVVALRLEPKHRRRLAEQADLEDTNSAALVHRIVLRYLYPPEGLTERAHQLESHLQQLAELAAEAQLLVDQILDCDVQAPPTNL